jgi:protein farnesyltransferase/geranylgeranyltransferase type-1 subunit alpha
LKEDVRNNSAWNQRYFFLKNNYDLTKSESIDILNEEIEFSLDKIEYCIDNESSWNYLRAIVNHLIDIYSLEKKKLDPSNNYLNKVTEFCDRKFQSNTEDDRSPFLLSYIVEMNMVKVDELLAYLEELVDENNQEERNKVLNELNKLVNGSIEILDLLANKFDTIRANYWNYQVSKWNENYSKYIIKSQ